MEITLEDVNSFYKVNMMVEYIISLFKRGEKYYNSGLSDQITTQIYIIGCTKLNNTSYDKHKWSEYIFLINKEETDLPKDFNTYFEEMMTINY